MPKVNKVFKWRHMLPSTYQEVEYIQSSGTQHIDTLHKHTANTKFEIKFNYQSQSGSWNMICGSRTSYNTSDCMNLYLHNSNYIAYGVGGTYNDNFYSSSINTDYVVSLSKTNITINGSSTSLSTSLTNYSYNDWIFGVNSNNSQVEQKVKMKLYYFKIYEGITLVRDFVPCYRKSDNVIGMYDLVNGVFYINAGTGSFTKGSDVSDLIEYQVYPSGPTPTPTITETHRFSEGGTSLYKQGYKIKEIELQFTCYYSSTARQSSSFGIIDPNNSNVDYRSIFRTGGEWHYSGYVDNGLGMVGGWKLNGSENYVIKFASNATVKQGGSCILKFNEGGGNIKVGTTFGTWIQDDDFAHTATIQTFVNSLFTSQTIAIASGAGGATISNDLMTVTYEPV